MTGRRTPDGESPSGTPSLDPRTWLKDATEPPPPPPSAGASESFDPRSWVSGDRRPPPAAKPDVASLPSRRGLILGGAATIAAAAGAGGWLLMRRGAGDAPPLPENPLIGASETSYEAPAVDGYAGLAQRLANYGVPPDDARRAVEALRGVAGADPGRMHLLIRLRDESAGRVVLTGAELRRARDGVGFQLVRGGEGFLATVLDAGLARKLIAHPRGQVNRDGLYASAVDTISPDLMTQFAEALAFDFDIAQEVREGDQFEVVHEEQIDARGNAVGGQKLLFAFMSAGGKDRYLYRFSPPGGDAGWFDDRGQSTRKAFMRTPLDGARITSLFGERKHPVLAGVVRNHNGIDFGCPIGTRVFAAAEAVVEYAGPARGFGMLLKLRHEGGLATWYGHLSGFPEGIAEGVAVAQGQVVALSGNTGVSSGPHLHYEVHKEGQPVDPKDFLDVQGAIAGGAQALAGATLDAFLAVKDQIDLARRSQS